MQKSISLVYYSSYSLRLFSLCVLPEETVSWHWWMRTTFLMFKSNNIIEDKRKRGTILSFNVIGFALKGKLKYIIVSAFLLLLTEKKSKCFPQSSCKWCYKNDTILTKCLNLAPYIASKRAAKVILSWKAILTDFINLDFPSFLLWTSTPIPSLLPLGLCHQPDT